MNKTLVFAALLFYLLAPSAMLQAQGNAPFFVSSIDKKTAPAGSVLAISGRGFPTSITDLSVSFGAVSISGTENIISASEFLIEARVPAGATFDNVVVTNLSTRRSASSSDLFTLSFQGATFDPANMAATITFTPTPALADLQPAYDLCVCDFNEDGKIDVALSQYNSADPTASENATMIPFFLNSTATAGAPPTFDLSGRVQVGSPTINLICGDLNGDGKPELLATQANQGATPGTQLFILRNQYDIATPSMPVFSTPATVLTLPPRPNGDMRSIRRVAIKDLDGDGRPEIIVNNETDGVLFVYVNNGTSDDISFASPPLQLEATGIDNGLIGLDVKDLNGDDFPEIIVAGKLGNKIVAFLNQSQRGELSFRSTQILDLPSVSITNLVVGDVASPDGSSTRDGKNDVIFTDATRHKIHVLANEGDVPGNTLEFGSGTFSLGVGDSKQPWGLDMGDMDGDGLLDVVVANVQNGGLYVFTKSSGASLFTDHLLHSPTTPRIGARNLRVVDANLDGKPDILLAAIGTSSPPLLVVTNQNCMIPSIIPDESGGVRVCQGGEFFAEATPNPAVSYTWEASLAGGGFMPQTASIDPTVPANHFDLSTLAPGMYDVRVLTSAPDGCMTQSSNTASVIATGTAPPAPTFANPTEMACGEQDLVIRATVPATATATGHRWSGPGGFTARTRNPILTVLAISAEQAGTYEYYYIDDQDCPSNRASVLVEVRNLPFLVPRFEGEPYACSGSFSKDLKVEEFIGFTLEWLQDGTQIPGAIDTDLPIYTAITPGRYAVEITDLGPLGCSRVGLDVPLSAIVRPGGLRIQRPTGVERADLFCVDVESAVMGEATPSPTAANEPELNALSYAWDTGDGTDFTTKDIMHTYTRADDYSIRLTVGYENLENCTSSVTETIRAIDEPTLAIQRSPDVEEKCPLETITLAIPATLRIPGGGTVGVATYTWNTGISDAPIEATEPGDYSVVVMDEAGCEQSASTTVANKENSGIKLQRVQTTEQLDVLEVTLAEEETVAFSVQNAQEVLSFKQERFYRGGIDTLLLSPIGLDTTNRTNPILTAFYFDEEEAPGPPYIYEVTAMDNSGCEDVAVLSLSIVADLVPQGYPIFSPNDDGVNDTWNVYRLGLYDDGACDVRIFDRRGAVVLEEDALPQNWEGWDGTEGGEGGKELTSGIYFYVVECDCEKGTDAGRKAEGDCPRQNSGSIVLSR